MADPVFDADMTRILDRCGVGQDFRSWLLNVTGIPAGGTFTPEDMAVMSPNEAGIRANILDEAAKEGPQKVGGATGVAVRVPVTKAWLACRKFLSQTEQVDRIDEGLPQSVERSLVSRWRGRHNFELIGDMMLIPQTQKKIYGIITASPRQVPVLLAEALRPSTTFASGQDTLQKLTRNDQGEAHFKEVVVDEVRGRFELYKRLRAFFWTVAYLSIEFLNWFSFQDSLYSSERILYFLNQTNADRRPPVHHVTQAWASAIARMVDIVRTTGCTFGEAVKRSAEWEHYFSFTPHSMLVRRVADRSCRMPMRICARGRVRPTREMWRSTVGCRASGTRPSTSSRRSRATSLARTSWRRTMSRSVRQAARMISAP